MHHAVKNHTGSASAVPRSNPKSNALRQARARRRLEERREQMALKQQLYDIFTDPAG